jgi:hypothetical protein
MIDIQLHKIQYTGIHCANKDCKRLPEYTINILGNVYYIKVDTTAVIISVGAASEAYCGGCIDALYDMVKSKLDRKLWAYH